MFERATPTWISIHTALAGCDEEALDLPEQTFEFQSTQPSQAVTDGVHHHHDGPKISIHTALAGCDGDTTNIDTLEFISIHTALAGCDEGEPDGINAKTISIHTALAGCDEQDIRDMGRYQDFNPHSPRRL